MPFQSRDHHQVGLAESARSATRPTPGVVRHPVHTGHARANQLRRAQSDQLSTAVNPDDIGPHIDELLEQAAAFARGGDLPGAVGRAYWACKELDSHAAVLVGDEWAADELRARVQHRIREYEHLLQEWQSQNAERQAAYLKRERAAIGADPDAQPGASRHVRKRMWWSRALTAFRTAFAA